MKRIIIILTILLVLLVAAIYVLIPSTLHVSESIKIPSSVPGAFRNLSDIDNWKKWLPEEKGDSQPSVNEGILTYQDNTFRINEQLYNDLSVVVYNSRTDSLHTSMLFVPMVADTFVLNWSYSYKTSVNPVKRIIDYNEAVKTKKQFTHMLQALKTFLSKNKNTYGIAITETSTKDTLLISTKSEFETYPSTSNIYSLIDKLKVYIQQHNARQTGMPMLNITPVENRYQVMVALPIDKSYAPTNDVVYKRMIPGAFFVTTVSGGDSAINFASRQIQQYFIDYKRVPAAIPFQILVTNRKENTDTSQWVTKLYFPVMN